MKLIFLKSCFWKICIGILTNIVAYMPVFVLIQLYKRTSGVWTKSIRLEKLIKKIESSLNKKKIRSQESKTIPSTFPWWFKIFLYLFSFVSMAFSIVLITFKGNCYKMAVFQFNYDFLF